MCFCVPGTILTGSIIWGQQSNEVNNIVILPRKWKLRDVKKFVQVHIVIKKQASLET